MEHWWNDTDRGEWSIGGMILTGGKQKYWEENLSQYHFVHHKSHTDWPNIEHALQLQSATNSLGHDMARQSKMAMCGS